MHALASHLKCTVAALEGGMSAREFMHWQAWMDVEQIGPAWERRRHAELLAAAHNGPCERRGGGLFQVADFMPPDPWAAAVPADQPAHAAALRRELRAMEDWFQP